MSQFGGTPKATNGVQFAHHHEVLVKVGTVDHFGNLAVESGLQLEDKASFRAPRRLRMWRK